MRRAQAVLLAGSVLALAGAWAAGGLAGLLRSGVVRTGCEGPLEGAATLLRLEAGEGCAARLAGSRRGRAALRWLARNEAEDVRVLAWGGLLHTPWEGWQEERDEETVSPPTPEPPPPAPAPAKGAGPSGAAAAPGGVAPSDDSREDVAPADRVQGPRGPRGVYASRPLPAPESAQLRRARDQVRWRVDAEAPSRAGLYGVIERDDAPLARRLAALRALEGHPGDMEVLERAARLPGLREYALSRLGPRDPAWGAWAKRVAHVRAARARACGAEVDVPPTLPAVEAPLDEPARHAWDVVAGMLLGEDTESADMARIALHVAAEWVAAAPERDRPARLLALVAPLGAQPGRPCEGGDASAALEGVGTPAMAALLAEALGVPLGIEVRVARLGETVKISIAGEVRELREGVPVQRATATSWAPRGAGAAMALSDALARAGRDPERLEARHAVWWSTARAAWPQLPGWIALAAPLRAEGWLDAEPSPRVRDFDGSTPPPAPAPPLRPAPLRPWCATRGFHPACSVWNPRMVAASRATTPAAEAPEETPEQVDPPAP